MGEEKISKLNDQPAVKGQIMEVLGNIYGLLSYHQKADSLLKMAMTLKQNLYKTPDPGLASISFSLAANKQILGEYDTTKV